VADKRRVEFDAKGKGGKPAPKKPKQSWSRRHRRELAPLYIAFAVLFTGWIVPDVDNAPAWIGPAGAATGLGALLLTRSWVDRKRERAVVIAGVLAVGLWLLLAARVGITRPMLYAWAALSLVGCVLWWIDWFQTAKTRKDKGGKPKKPGRSTKPEDVWEEYLSQTGQALPGSRLTSVKRNRHGWEGKIILPRGVLTTEDAIKATERVASAYEVPLSAVAIEEPRGGVATHAKITLLEDNPLQKAHPFPGPTLDPETGMFEAGVYVDGEKVCARLWRPQYGALHALISGSTGSGKSAAFNTILANAVHSDGLVAPWIVDPQNGQSFPGWDKHVDWAAYGLEEARIAIRSAHTLMLDRNRRLGAMKWEDSRGREQTGIGHFTPTVDMPLVLLLIDEAHMVLSDDECCQLVKEISQMARKCGIALWLATQVPSVSQLGGDSTLKDQLKAGYAFILRTASRVGSGMAVDGALPVLPHKIPKEMPDGSTSAGLGFVVGADRAAMMRWFYLGDESAIDIAETGEPGRLSGDDLATIAVPYAARRGRKRDLPAPQIEGVPASTQPMLLADEPEPIEHAQPIVVREPVVDEPIRLTVTAAEPDVEDDEDLYGMAVELVTTTTYATRQMLGRKLRIGWDDAGYLIEQLVAAGVIGLADDEGRHEVLTETAAESPVADLDVRESPETENEPETGAERPEQPAPSNATEAVRQFADAQRGEFAGSRVQLALPHYSRSSIKVALRTLVEEGYLSKPRHGFYATKETAS